jgi:hypothetical protein
MLDRASATLSWAPSKSKDYTLLASSIMCRSMSVEVERWLAMVYELAGLLGATTTSTPEFPIHRDVTLELASLGAGIS